MMKERSKEKMAELLMEELLSQLGERGNIKKMLGEMTGLPIAALIKNLVEEFELVVEKYHRHSFDRAATETVEMVGRRGESYVPDNSPSIPLPVESEDNLIEHPPPVQTPELGPTDVISTSEVPEPEAAPPEGSMMADDARQEVLPPIASIPVPPPSSARVIEPVTRKEMPEGEPPKEKEQEVSGFRKRLEELARRVENEYLEQLEKDKRKPAQPPKVAASSKLPSETALEPPDEEEIPVKREVDETDLVAAKGKPPRIPYRLDARDHIYLHGVMRIPPDESPVDEPFMLEEKGVDPREFAFAMDISGLRFFLSKVNQNEMSVSRKGVLLLGKSESLQLRGLHEGILNELRSHGMVLPMEFGTVAKGRDDLMHLVQRYGPDIETALDKLIRTQWWTLTLYVLDGRIAHLFATEADSKQERVGRERDRLSYSPPMQQKKFDVKLLEKILQKEKRLAESVHHDLSELAERSEVQTMVGLGSGSSDEWKVILKASYYFTGTDVRRFSRAVTDLQYRHILFEPMFAVIGDQEYFSFLKR